MLQGLHRRLVTRLLPILAGSLLNTCCFELPEFRSLPKSLHISIVLTEAWQSRNLPPRNLRLVDNLSSQHTPQLLARAQVRVWPLRGPYRNGDLLLGLLRTPRRLRLLCSRRRMLGRIIPAPSPLSPLALHPPRRPGHHPHRDRVVGL